MTAALLASLSSAMWGSADYVGGVLSRRRLRWPGRDGVLRRPGRRDDGVVAPISALGLIVPVVAGLGFGHVVSGFAPRAARIH